MFKELSDKIKYPELERAVLQFWAQHRIFEQSVTTRSSGRGFTFFEGPPTANGRPGIHHVMARTLKDLVCRYKTMRGFQVHRKAGWDTHGLPVEIEVEKQLGFKHKEDIVRFGVAEFNAKCRESVWKYKAEWEQMTERMGYWVDLNNPYVTFENNYIESVWWSLKQYFDKDMIYKGFKIQPYCPRCETPLSSHEVSLGYEDVKDPSVYVRMKVKGEERRSFLVWTTTPWTLISNVAIAVHPDIDYVTIGQNGEQLILAESRLSVIEGEYTVVSKCKGHDLAGMSYERLYSYHPVKEKAHYVIEAEFVTTEDGTGIVHIAPAYGEDDYQISRKYGLPAIHPVNRSGEFGPEVTAFSGKFVKEADPEIIRDLKARGILYKKETITHSYPHCWRCGTPLLYYARESWYIATTKYAARMVELNREINWCPPEVGDGRFGNWLEENKDWSLSRDRFWGTPLPIWICETCGKQRCVGSVEEYRKGDGVREPVDLHKPFVDEVTFRCDCGGTMRRTPELIDVWYDSGAMQFAQWHYPFEHRELIDSGEQHPADFICEGVDQTRGWFYSLHSISTFLFDEPSFRNVIVNELILDRSGQKMSKSKGNTVDPFAILEKYGADTLRWYLVTNSPPWRTTLFNEDDLGDVQRKFLGTLVNTYVFFAMYANIDGFTHSEPPVPVKDRPEIDRWIISVLNSLIGSYREAMDQYDVTKAARLVSDFTGDQLSNWYVRRNRRRFWSKSDQSDRVDKLAAYQTLYECLVTVTQLMAPVAPFLSEELFRNLTIGAGGSPEASVHLALIPGPDARLIDSGLESRMERAEHIVSLVRAIRNRANLKVRQPLRRIIVPVTSEHDRKEVERMEDVILDEINVKAIEYVHDDSEIIHKSAKPNFKVLGPKHGKAVQPIGNAIRAFTPQQIRTVETAGSIAVEVTGASYTVTREDIEIQHEDIRGWLVESDAAMTVALDTELSDELIAEGFAREFVNRIQNMRKDSGFEVTDRIRIRYTAGGKLAPALLAHADYIRNETLAVEVTPAAAGNGTVEQEINGERCQVGIERVAAR